MAGGRIRRRGIWRYTQQIKFFMLFLTFGSLLVWRYSFSYTAVFRSLTGDPRNNIGVSSQYGGCMLGRISMGISDVGWEQLKAADSRWLYDPGDEPLVEFTPIEFHLSSVHPPVRFLPHVYQANYFRNPCTPGRCAHGDRCEVVYATSSSVAVWIPYWLVFFLYAFVTYRIMWRDRPWPAGVCQVCGFDLRGSESGKCPECSLGIPAEERQSSGD